MGSLGRSGSGNPRSRCVDNFFDALVGVGNRQATRARIICLGRLSSMIDILQLQQDEWPAVWQLIEPVFRAGETYAFSPDISETEARKVWLEVPTASYVAKDDEGNILGTYFIKPNQPGLGSHVCNCGYIVGEQARGQG